ncbi:hypothetical protein PS685_05183 [Pseudomonas fluorescens]|uniref:Uncharacterized protein n=1 Tax=Pseudomonas fluorescens TaxID=294 RepID=A0A5E6ZPN7_PSEFL|nr:hypothetical protein PS685_04892 [Pseudomonas fluorescens]VVN73721.1 hypothetical protein PS685_05183 [Pseudomonas fluorescens]
MAQGEFFNISIGRRLMQIANGFIQRGQLIVLGQLRRQPVGQAARAEHGQALLAELTQALLGQAFGGGVDGRQRGVDRWRFVAGNGAVFGMVDLQSRSAGAGFAIAAHFGATFEAFLLRIAEVVEAQTQAAGAIVDAHQQAAALAHDHVGANDPALDNGILTGAQSANRDNAGAVLIAQRQME